jgi:protein-disulfide isomerase
VRYLKSILRSLPGLTVGALLACSPGERATPDTSDVTRALLAQPAGDGRSTPLAQGPEAGAERPSIPLSEVGLNRGSPEAPVKVLELSDYGCGYCRQFHEETFPSLLEEFIDTGMVEWKFVPFVTGMFDNSPAATEAAECALAQGTEAFEALNDRIWTDQADWKRSGEPAPMLRGWAAEAGLEMAAFDACLAGDERMDRVLASTGLARELGVRGTPTFVVLGYSPLQGALPLDVFRRVLQAVHAEATAPGGP